MVMVRLSCVTSWEQAIKVMLFKSNCILRYKFGITIGSREYNHDSRYRFIIEEIATISYNPNENKFVYTIAKELLTLTAFKCIH